MRRIEFAELHVGHHEFAGDIGCLERLDAPDFNVNRFGGYAGIRRPGCVRHSETGNVHCRIADSQPGA